MVYLQKLPTVLKPCFSLSFFPFSWKFLSIHMPTRDPSLDQVFVLFCNGLSQSPSDTGPSLWVSAWSSMFTEARVYSRYWEIQPLCMSSQMNRSSYFWFRSGVCLLGACTQLHSVGLWGISATYCQGLYDQALIKFLSQRLSKKLRAREAIEKWRIWCLRSVGTQTNDKKTKCSKAK